MTVDISAAERIVGWMSPRELQWLAEQAATHHCIAEVGSFRGRSTLALADHTDGTVYAIDTWDSVIAHDDQFVTYMTHEGDYEVFTRNVSHHLDSGKIITSRGNLRAFAQRGVLPDMVFLDADHRYKGFLDDLCVAESLLAFGGLLCGHDYGTAVWPGLTQLVDTYYPQACFVDSIWFVEL